MATIIVPFGEIVADAALDVLKKKKTYTVEYTLEWDDLLPPTAGLTVRFRVLDAGAEVENTTTLLDGDNSVPAPDSNNPIIKEAMFNLLLDFMKL